MDIIITRPGLHATSQCYYWSPPTSLYRVWAMERSDYEAVPISILSFHYIPQSSPFVCAVYKFCLFSTGQQRNISRRPFERRVNILHGFTAAKLLVRCPSALKTGGILYKLRGPGPDYVAYVFVSLRSFIICQFYKSAFSNQIPLQLWISFSDFV